MSAINVGSLGIARSGVRSCRTNNYNLARNHFENFLKFTGLMNDAHDGTLEEWLASINEGRVRVRVRVRVF